MGQVVCPKTSVINYQSTQRNIPEERSSHTATEAWNQAYGYVRVIVSVHVFVGSRFVMMDSVLYTFQLGMIISTKVADVRICEVGAT